MLEPELSYQSSASRNKDHTLRPAVILRLCQQLDAFNVDASNEPTCAAEPVSKCAVGRRHISPSIHLFLQAAMPLSFLRQLCLSASARIELDADEGTASCDFASLLCLGIDSA